jgi:hypothetical protein
VSRVLGFLVALVALLGTARPAGAFVKTHGVMLDSVAVSVAADLLRGTATDRSIVVLVPIPGDSLGVLAQRLLERLRAEGRDVRLRERALQPVGTPPTLPPGDMTQPASDSIPAMANGPPPLELRARVDGTGVAYVRRIRSFPFGVKGYERLVSMRASATCVDPRTGSVLWARSASASATDFVSKRDLAYMAGGSAGFNPPLPQGSGFRLLEPLIVLGVVTGLVVLFYSNRN